MLSAYLRGGVTPEIVMIDWITIQLQGWSFVPEEDVEVWAHVLAVCGIFLLAAVAHFIGRFGHLFRGSGELPRRWSRPCPYLTL